MDLSDECTYFSELIFTLGLEPSTIRLYLPIEV
ncbi:unnamed protein product [Schistosoma margrebowiei]|uniref:Uncharacterized protein n=1 Tax=Schistosoma margrebowiei TaxID=48269 RepID=A0A3P8DE86_9TREM|nr:unnamed protein product [Schistosoma margrebowiei]